METIKISVEVSVNLSENTQKFLTSLFAAGVPSGAQVAASVSKPAPAALAKPAPAKPTPQPAAPAQTVAPTNPAPTVPVTTAPTYTLDQIAKAGASLVDAGKMEQLLALLAKYGVQAVTQLQPDQYGVFATELRTLGAQL